MNKNIHDLKFNEWAKISEPMSQHDWIVKRVPGGWIYTFHSHHSVFVPYSREFKQSPIKQKLQRVIQRVGELIAFAWNYRGPQ